MPPHVKINPIRPRVQYVADGIKVVFVYPFAIFSSRDLEVYVDGQRYADGYQIAGAGDTGGGTVTFSSAPAAGSQITLRRNLVLQRTCDFQDSGTLRARVLNDELDYLVAALQQFETEISRCVRLQPTDADAALILPEQDIRAQSVLAFDQNGNVVLTALGAASTQQGWRSLDDIPEGQQSKHLTAEEKLLLASMPASSPLIPPPVSETEKLEGQVTELRSFSPKDIVDMIRGVNARQPTAGEQTPSEPRKETCMASRIQVNHADVRRWLEVNPVLALGEFGLESDTRRLKVGDGETAWDRLGYSIDVTYTVSDAQKLGGIDVGAQKNPPLVSASERSGETCTETRSFSPADIIELARVAAEFAAVVDGGDSLGIHTTVIDGGNANG